jgi:hypothetical protein
LRVQVPTSATHRGNGTPRPVTVPSANAAPVDRRGTTWVERSTSGERAERSPAGVAG